MMMSYKKKTKKSDGISVQLYVALVTVRVQGMPCVHKRVCLVVNDILLVNTAAV